VLKNTGWRAKDVANATQERHLELLEQELKKDPSSRLEAHIRRLKVAWGRACKTPDHQAA
jgi:hypothetical protein